MSVGARTVVVAVVVICVLKDASVAVSESSVAVSMSKNPTGPAYVSTHVAAVVPDTAQSIVTVTESSVSTATKVEGPKVAVT
jgi:hypothetical protein